MKRVLPWGVSMSAAMVFLAGAIVLTSGCGGPGVSTAKAQGKVTVAGQPMAGIVVTFQPAAGRIATGVTDASGNFKMSTFGDADGAVLGTHKVYFSHSSSSATPDITAPPSAEPTQPFNAKYLSGDTSGITAEVASGKPNDFTWDLEK